MDVTKQFGSCWSCLLLDEQADQEEGDGADDAENEDDTRLPLREVLLSLDEVLDGSLAAARDERHIKSGHCEIEDLLQKISSSRREYLFQSLDVEWAI